jgi:hypothetical protein
MGTLRDEAYEKLDYLSQLTEVVIGPQSEVLGKVPDRVELTFEQVNQCKVRTWGLNNGYELSLYQVLSEQLPAADYQYVNDIKEFFEFQVSEDFELDIANKKMTGTIAMVKLAQHIDEKKMLELAVDKACRHLNSYGWPAKNMREKTITVLNTLEPNSGTEWAKSVQNKKSSWSAVAEIRKVFTSAILENKWRIRDANVITNVCKWIDSYLTDETNQDLGLVNLVKLKIMIDKDLPVYSIDEVKNANPT